MVTLSWWHSTNHTPSVSLCSTAPPLGSRGPCCPRWGWCVAQPSLPPLGEVPRSGKGGVVGNFEPLPSNEPHPLSQAVRPASSPIGEPSFPCCPRWGWCAAPLSLPPAGGSAATAAKGVALVALSRYHPTNHTPSVSPYGLPAPPLGSRVSLAAPAGGSAAAAAKGVASVILSRFHPTNHTPSVSLCSTAPPSGSRVLFQFWKRR